MSDDIPRKAGYEQRSDARLPFQPFTVRNIASRTPVAPVAFGCLKIIFVRAGSALLFGEFGVLHVSLGDVVVLAPGTLWGAEPEGLFRATTIYLEREFLIDLVFWQYTDQFIDRLETKHCLDVRPVEPAQLLHVTTAQVVSLAHYLDQLVTLTTGRLAPEDFFHAQSLLFAVLDAVVPKALLAKHSGASERVLRPRQRQFLALRAEARETARLLSDAPERHWTLDELADRVHLSQSQLRRVFLHAFGVPPIVYLTTLRIEKMAHLLRTTGMSVARIAKESGWRDADFASQQFRRSLGLTPRQYRQLCRRGELRANPGDPRISPGDFGGYRR